MTYLLGKILEPSNNCSWTNTKQPITIWTVLKNKILINVWVNYTEHAHNYIFWYVCKRVSRDKISGAVAGHWKLIWFNN
jgi:hypothetical protein